MYGTINIKIKTSPGQEVMIFGSYTKQKQKGNSTTLLTHIQDNPRGERLHTFKLPTMICNAYDFSNQPSFYVTTTTSFHFFDFDPKPPATSLLTCNVVTLKSIPRMPNDIAPRVFPYKSFQWRPLPSFTVLIPLHSPNLQSIALCSTFDDLIFGHGQPTQTPKK